MIVFRAARLRRSSSASLLFLSALPVAVGCSSPNDEPAVAEAGVDDVGVDSVLPDTHFVRDTTPDLGPEVDRGEVSETYPAFKPEMPQLVANGGYVMKAPEITTVTWVGDKLADRFEQFSDQLGASDYWKAAVSEYGIGPATSGADHHVRLADPLPTTVTTDDLDAFVATATADVGTSKWPAPKDDSIYILYLPSSVRLLYDGGDACLRIGGYHTSTIITLPDGEHDVAYAIIPYCRGFGGGYVDSMLKAASHEIGEASTDPHPATGIGIVGVDRNHHAWTLFNQGLTENGDMCSVYRESFIDTEEPAFAQPVQRLWSNKAAAAGHDPCVPAAGTYFNVTPLEPELVTLNLTVLGAGKVKTHGYAIAVGDERTIPIGFYSEAKMDAFSFDAVEGNALFGGSGGRSLDIRVLGGTGQNGQKAAIVVKVLAAGTIDAGRGIVRGGELITLVATNAAGDSHYMPIVITNP